MTPEEFQRLSEMFEAVIQQQPERREACIDALSAGNEELREELRVLVESHRENDRFLESGVIEDADGPLHPGDSIAHYTIEREIGNGGMGIVYLADDTRLDRKVAVKALHSHLVADARQRERFRQEARAAALLSHPAVATVHALEELDGHFYIVSEYVRGETLAATLEREKFSPNDALQIAVQVAEGLAEAHDRGIIHRDLKPQNVIRTPQQQPKIIDFGLARIRDSDSIETAPDSNGAVDGVSGIHVSGTTAGRDRGLSIGYFRVRNPALRTAQRYTPVPGSNRGCNDGCDSAKRTGIPDRDRQGVGRHCPALPPERAWRSLFLDPSTGRRPSIDRRGSENTHAAARREEPT